MPKMPVLVVDDDAEIRSLLREVLELEGFVVLEAATAQDTMALLEREKPCLVTLDIRMGDDNGFQIARDIRAVSNVPIIIVTGQGDVIDRVVGLEIGADDYIPKPFHVRELVARVRSVLRRYETAGVQEADPVLTEKQTPDRKTRCLRFDGMSADLDQMQLRDRDGADCGLTSGDFRLLTVFLERPMHALSRDQLMDLTGGTLWSPLDRTIDNQVARLRKKIERDPANPQLIKTIRSIGYKFTAQVETLSDPS